MPQQISLTPTHFIPRTRATHQRLHIRSARDAHILFEAVRLGALPMVTQRLSVVDCQLLQPGQVYCWEQDNGETGIERWTDGRRWGASRARENFLFYIEGQPTSEKQEGSSMDSYHIPHEQRAPWDFRQDEMCSGFTKQTYSAWVKLSPIHPPRRWNLTAYFSGIDYLSLPTVDNDAILSRFSIPPGTYTTVDSLLKKSERRSTASTDSSEITPQTRSIIHSTHQTSSLNPNEQAVHAPPPRNPLPSDRDLDHDNLPNTDNQDGPVSPLPRSPEDQRALSMFKLQL